MKLMDHRNVAALGHSRGGVTSGVVDAGEKEGLQERMQGGSTLY